ncbi:hypothetical protein Lqui_2717 [Legionella quinlivanii]|uniref:DH domain-containing protein n=1 Tax=Legionella quinlivanii TaxID=45073 RepID=A0A0W0XL61_9GAMM|nr:RhoGEF domain-containing protein [Legionella quinlivanii]KTD45246.1 hypothetical protein Lqui_2717 [Legionella quinlivanii]SEG03973.1 RhoGEF domain-containing protein [Legionella quinlivanii DSM 21216]STY11454.1 Uncharacterised protein [Legionella quinlivanii]
MKDKKELRANWIAKSDSKAAYALEEIIAKAETAYASFNKLSDFLYRIDDNHEMDSYIENIEDLKLAYEKMEIDQLITNEDDSLETVIGKLTELIQSPRFAEFISRLEKAALVQPEYSKQIDNAVKIYNDAHSDPSEKISLKSVENVAIVPMQHLMRYPLLIGALQSQADKSAQLENSKSELYRSLDKVMDFAQHFENAKAKKDNYLGIIDQNLEQLKKEAMRLSSKNGVVGEQATELYKTLLDLRERYARARITIDEFKQETTKEIEAAQKTDLGKHRGILDSLVRLFHAVTGITLQTKSVAITNQMKASLTQMKDEVKTEADAELNASETASMSGP